MNRRTLLSLSAAAGLLAVESSFGAEQAPAENAVPRRRRRREPLKFDNDSFYKDGKFDTDKAKDAIVALCRYFHYPLFPDFREKLWVSDYGTGKFTELGLAAYGYVNNDSPLGETFMAQDLFLLPGQMLPEHWHIKGAAPAIKNEGWIIRCGESLIVGIGQPNLPETVKIPLCHMNGTTETKHGQLAKVGQYVPLAKVETKHWQLAGPEGCIITEVANLHEDKAVRHNDEAINKNFLGL